MSATTRSIASSCAGSQASSAASRCVETRVAAVEPPDRRRLAHRAGPAGAPERGQQRLEPRRLGLQRRLVDDQARRDLHDLLDLGQLVRAQRAAAAHQVDDGVGQPDQRGQFHRAVELDQVDVHALGREVLARDLHVLGGDAQPRTTPHRIGVVEAVRRRDAHPATRDAQVDRLVQALAAVLEQHVLAGHAEVGSAVLHVGRHVRSAHDDQPQVGIAGGQDQLARSADRGVHRNARGGEQRQGFVEYAALRQG